MLLFLSVFCFCFSKDGKPGPQARWNSSPIVLGFLCQKHEWTCLCICTLSEFIINIIITINPQSIEVLMAFIWKIFLLSLVTLAELNTSFFSILNNIKNQFT